MPSSPRVPPSEGVTTTAPKLRAAAPTSVLRIALEHRALVLPARRELLVGTAPGCDLRLDDPYVSARHLTLTARGGGVAVEDLGSTNGTWVDGVRVRQGWAPIGASIRCGDQRLVVVADAPGRPLRDVACSMVGESLPLQEVRRKLERFAGLRAPVLIRGETGVGKDLAARSLHRLGSCNDAPFIDRNCASFEPELAESELFGHVRGAFTGADRNRAGAFTLADGGTLFLDEVGELALPLQAKLLRVLETSFVLPVGAERGRPVSVRIVAATHRNLEAMVRAGTFREDLYHRLSVLTVEIPPLRQRPSDIAKLLEHFCAQAVDELGRKVELSADAIEAARRHPWPGNVRALRNAVIRAGAQYEGIIDAQALLADVPAQPGRAGELELPPASMMSIPVGDYRQMNMSLLQRCVDEHGSINKAARALGIPRSTLSSWFRRARGKAG